MAGCGLKQLWTAPVSGLRGPAPEEHGATSCGACDMRQQAQPQAMEGGGQERMQREGPPEGILEGKRSSLVDGGEAPRLARKSCRSLVGGEKKKVSPGTPH